MKRRPAYVFFLAGCLLLLVLLPLTAWLASVAPPTWLNEMSRQFPQLAEFIWALLSSALPLLLASLVFGALVFRLAGEPSRRAAVWCSAGLLLPLCLVQFGLMFLHGASLAAFGQLLLAPAYWLALAAPALGLWLAAAQVGRRVRQPG